MPHVKKVVGSIPSYKEEVICGFPTTKSRGEVGAQQPLAWLHVEGIVMFYLLKRNIEIPAVMSYDAVGATALLVVL